MKFIVHDYHNNNSYPVGSFKSPMGDFFIPHDGYVTDEGITFFMLPKTADLEDRVTIVTSLHALLKDRYNQGLSAVTCAISDCVRSEEFEGLFSRVKNLDPSIKTIEVIHESFNGLSHKKSAHADYSIEGMNNRDLIHSTILAVVNPTSPDKDEPKEGWGRYRAKMSILYQLAENGELPPARPIRDFVRRHFRTNNNSQ